MKKLAIAALASTFVLAGCSTMGLDNERDMVVEGQAVSVKVVNIPSFEVEIAPRKALCEMMDTVATQLKLNAYSIARLIRKTIIL